MKIAFISYTYPPDTGKGGIGTYTTQIAGILKKKDFEVHIFAGSNSRNDVTIEDGIPVHRVKCTDPVDFQLKVIPFFRDEHSRSGFDLVESPEINANALEIKKQFPGIPLLVRLHAPNHLVESLKKKYMPLTNKWRFFLGALRKGKWDLGYWKKYDPSKDIDYNFTKQADYISAPTVQMKNWVVKYWHLAPASINVVENPFTANDAFIKAVTDNSQKAVIFFGRLNILKGLYTATLAMKHILQKNADWKWIIVGDDGPAMDAKSSMKEWMTEQLKEVNKQVVFVEGVHYEDLPSFLKQASVVLVPSLFESYSYVTIEGMSAGKAVIGSSDTGISSLIEDNKNGLLADAHKIRQWQEKIQLLIDDEVLRKQLGSNAIEYARNKYRVNEQISLFYHGILKKSK